MEGNRDPLTEQIIGAAIEVHRAVGPGLLESIYEECMCRELAIQELSFQRQVPVPLIYKGVRLENPLRMDLVVEDQVVLELKAVDKLSGLHEAQLLSYLKLAGKRRGLLMNFNSERLVDGVKRMVL
ncbi:MAG: GxxExxY protein [Planctomycetales bacterium]|nr:GxxExxY protein [bacterium]UNM08184.1 MAG: GxxExxY protein [Planctomycetales bacterium]